jgi:putative oxidoreductase
MSATSRNFRGARDADEGVVASPGGVVQKLIATDWEPAATVARLALGIVMFPHAAQKVFGWFGGYGLEGTYGFFTTGPLGLPGVLAGTVIAFEFLGSIMLILGALTRLGAFMIGTIMFGAIVTTHIPNGFFMNWTGKQPGEGFEYHILALGLALVTIMLGGGALSVDRSLTRKAVVETAPPLREPVTEP